MFKCPKQRNTEAIVLNIEKFDIRYCFEFRVSIFGFLPEREFSFRHYILFLINMYFPSTFVPLWLKIGQYLIVNFSRVSSVIISVPKSIALLSLDPGAVPATI